MRKGFWASDWFAGLVISLALLVASWQGYLGGLERVVYDFSVNRFFSPTPNEKIAIIAIDEESLRRIGPWPWPRSVHAKLLSILAGVQPLVVGSTLSFPQTPPDPSASALNDLIDFYGESSLASAGEELRRLNGLIRASEARQGEHAPKDLKNLYDYAHSSSLGGDLGSDIEELNIRLLKAKRELDSAEALASSVRLNANVVLALPYSPNPGAQESYPSLPQFMHDNVLRKSTDNQGFRKTTYHAKPAFEPQPPAAALGGPAALSGFTPRLRPATDGPHNEPLVLRYKDELYPSLPLALLAQTRALGAKHMSVSPLEGLFIGQERLITDRNLGIQAIRYQRPDKQPAFAIDSFADVLQGGTPPVKFNDRIVLIGTTAPAARPGERADAEPAVIGLAHSLSSLMNREYLITPFWGGFAQAGALLLAGVFLIGLLPRLQVVWGFAIGLIGCIAALGASYYFMATQAQWWSPLAPVLALVLGPSAILALRLIRGESMRSTRRTPSAESARMAALAFQGQGQLDMAFDKLRTLPRNDDIMELLYNLGLDFERERNYVKSLEVYQYMNEHDARYRDLQQRIIRSKAMGASQESGANKLTTGGTLVIQDGTRKPMLGRYEVLEELGKGAMGVVYLGQDPTISRTVAIKTLDLNNEFDDKDIAEVKARFFREAETAGRLSHPHIVTIFDAGEEHDLAYIAMEYLNGEDLTHYTQPKQLLPLSRAMDIVAKCADALAYAHDHGVVHRDIKPANVMYEEDTGELKITDFGIARITDSSRTKTGMVLGTPSYMSPEQLSGKRVDGRSDLFSLGIMLFQMITGKLPFRAESMATLMYKIANESHPSIKDLRPELPECIDAIINKALDKDRAKRFQTGTEMVKDIHACMRDL